MPSLRHSTTVPVLEPPVAEPDAGLPHPGESLGGYRIIRMIGRGSRATVYLGFSESTADSGEPSTAALKVFHAGVDSVSVELDALARAAHPHVVHLLDVASTPSGEPCIVMERLPRGSVADLLRSRTSLSPGEAVTILAPIAVAVDALHETGIVHGSIGARSVLFRESGAPVLAGFGRVRLIEPGLPAAALASLDPVARDREDLAMLAQLILERAGMDAAIVPDPISTDHFGETLALRLFDSAGAEPLRFGGDDEVASAVPARVGAARVRPVRVARRGRSGRSAWSGRSARAGRTARTGRSTGAARATSGRRVALPVRAPRDSARAGTGVARIGQQLRAVRTPVWVAAASVVIALIAALVLVPADGPAAVEPGPAVTDTPVPVAEDSPIAGDDPVEALSALLATRADCISAMSIVCIDGVVQSGSQAADADLAIVRSLQDGGEIPDDAAIGVGEISVGEISVVERLGDTVLLDLGGEEPDSKPASVLVIRTEAGWRIRDYLAG